MMSILKKDISVKSRKKAISHIKTQIVHGACKVLKEFSGSTVSNIVC
jgi:hypothetical protein